MQEGIPLLAFHRGAMPPGFVELLKKFSEDATRRWHVRCPACAWQPGPSSHWHCQDTDAPEYFSPGCGAVWNTFSTRGTCPGCDHQWRWTACLQCDMWSRHEDWYVPEGGPDDGA